MIFQDQEQHLYLFIYTQFSLRKWIYHKDINMRVLMCFKAHKVKYRLEFNMKLNNILALNTYLQMIQ